MTPARPHRPLLLGLVALALLLSGCAESATSSSLDRVTVAFVLVGSQDDLGYNQAVFEGTLAVARRFPDTELILLEDVPETEESGRVMRELVTDRGADVIFATSFGHLPFAYEVAREFPEVIVLHQGGTEPDPPLHNFGTYFGSHWEAMYEAGIAAGDATTTGVLGFIAAFPIPATHANVDAFTLGAQRVRPDVKTQVVYTEDWCNPDLQRALAKDLIRGGADVLGLHQDCTKAILQEAEAAGVGVVGYHADGSEAAPTRWLVGAVWNWGTLYSDILRTVLEGRFTESPYTGDYRGSIADGNNPFILTTPGPSVSTTTRAQMQAAREELLDGGTPFQGPLVDNDGVQRLQPGETLGVADIDRLDWFVVGVEVR